MTPQSPSSRHLHARDLLGPQEVEQLLCGQRRAQLLRLGLEPVREPVEQVLGCDSGGTVQRAGRCAALRIANRTCEQGQMMCRLNRRLLLWFAAQMKR